MDINKLVLSEEALRVVDEGAWVAIPVGGDIIEFKVTGLSRNQEAQDTIRNAMEQIRKDNKRAPTEKEKESIVRRVLADIVLKDWRGITDNGKALPYSKDLANKFLTERGGEQFASLVLDAATQIDNNSYDFIDEITKN